MRVGIAMMSHETNTFSPVVTDLARFSGGHDRPRSGAAAVEIFRGTASCLGGYIKVCDELGMEIDSKGDMVRSSATTPKSTVSAIPKIASWRGGRIFDWKRRSCGTAYSRSADCWSSGWAGELTRRTPTGTPLFLREAARRRTVRPDERVNRTV